VPITTKVASSNPDHGEVYSKQHYVIKFVSDLRQVGGCIRLLRFLHHLNWPLRYNWIIVESGVKHHNLNSHNIFYNMQLYLIISLSVSCIINNYLYLFWDYYMNGSPITAQYMNMCGLRTANIWIGRRFQATVALHTKFYQTNPTWKLYTLDYKSKHTCCCQQEDWIWHLNSKHLIPAFCSTWICSTNSNMTFISFKGLCDRDFEGASFWKTLVGSCVFQISLHVLWSQWFFLSCFTISEC